MFSTEFRDQRAPCQFVRRQFAAVFSRRFFKVTASAKRLQPVHVARVLAVIALHRHDMIAFETAGPPAHDTTPAVAVEHDATHGGPAAGIQGGMVSAHISLVRQEPVSLEWKIRQNRLRVFEQFRVENKCFSHAIGCYTHVN